MSTGAAPIDDAVLETFYSRAQTHPLIETVAGDRTGDTLTLIRATLDPDQYPAHTSDAKLEIQWYTNGDHNVYYRETHSTETHWQCRWD